MITFNEEQFIIVTGASSGIGRTTALLLNDLGASVIAIARREDKLQTLKNECKKPQNLHIDVKDLTENIDALPQYVKSLKDKYGKLSGMAYCAGVGCISPIRSVSFQDMQEVFAINYFAPVFLLKGLVDKRNNVGKGTSIVAIASCGAISCDAGMTAYAGSKGAMISTFKSVAAEVSDYGIRVNCVSPSLINTDMADDVSRAYADGKYPFGLGQPDDVANMIVYLLSDKSKWLTKMNYVIDCGGVS